MSALFALANSTDPGLIALDFLANSLLYLSAISVNSIKCIYI